jgi:hypothetical protein
MTYLISILFALMVAFSLPSMANNHETKPQTKKVCVKTTDAKTKKEIEKCRDIKIHKKLEGTEIPPAKK